MFNKNPLILGIFFIALIFLLGCTNNPTKPTNTNTTDTNSILAPPKGLCNDSVKGALYEGQTLNAGKYVITLETISVGSPNKVTVNVKDTSTGLDKSKVLTEGTPTDFMFGPSKVTVLFKSINSVGGTAANLEVCYDQPTCQSPIANGLIDYGDQLNVGGLYLLKINTISFGSPNTIQLDIYDVSTGKKLTTNTFVDGMPLEITIGTNKFTVTASVDYSTGTKVKLSVCGDLPAPLPAPKCAQNPTGVGTSTIHIGKIMKIEGRYEILLENVQDMMGKKYVSVIVTDTLTFEQRSQTLEVGQSADLNFRSGVLTLSVTSANVALVALDSDATIVACAELLAPPKCNPSVDTMTVVTLAQGEKILWNSRFEIEVQGILGTDQAIVKITDKTTTISRVYTIAKGVAQQANIGGLEGISLLLENIDLRIGNQPSTLVSTITVCDKVSDFQGGIIY